jgi:Holliday junction DNA helicase RuvA
MVQVAAAIVNPAAGDSAAVYTRLRPAIEPIRTHNGHGMIAQLTGLVDALEDGRCVIDVAGVGYLVHASSRTLAALPRPPEVVKLLVETQVREDAIQLFGFSDTAERDWFRLLTTVQGVGPRVALSMLSALSPPELIGAIASRDQASLTRAPGVGARLAARLLTELKDKVGAMPSSPGVGIPLPVARPVGTAGDALSALVNLGYRRPEAQTTVARVVERLGDNAALDAIIRDSLKELAGRAGL